MCFFWRTIGLAGKIPRLEGQIFYLSSRRTSWTQGSHVQEFLCLIKGQKRKFRKDTENLGMYTAVLLKSGIQFCVQHQLSLAGFFMALCLCLFELLNVSTQKCEQSYSFYLIRPLLKLKICVIPNFSSPPYQNECWISQYNSVERSSCHFHRQIYC